VKLAYRLPEEVLPFFEALERSPDPVFVTDRQNLIVSWNRSSEHLLGFTPEEAVGAPCSSLLGGCDAWGNRYCAESCPVREMAGRGEVVNHFDLKLRSRDGRGVVIDLNILHLAAPAPHHFFLAHILKPSLRSSPAPRVEEDSPAPPRPALQTVKDSPDARARKLTQREIEILGMLAAGRTTAEIASVLSISALTARNHTQNILEKLEVHSKAEAVAFAFQKRLF
jgi:PAS domain S-box-containing protein